MPYSIMMELVGQDEDSCHKDKYHMHAAKVRDHSLMHACFRKKKG
jgi:hypothetical protein